MGGYLCPGYLSKDFCIISLLSAAQKLGTIFTFVNHIKHEWQCLMAGVTVAGDNSRKLNQVGKDTGREGSSVGNYQMAEIMQTLLT